MENGSRKRFNPLYLVVGILSAGLLLFAGLYFLKPAEPRITAKDRAQLEEFQRTGTVSGLNEEVSRNIAEFQRQQGINPVAPALVAPAVRSDFKAEYKITGPAAKKVEFKFLPPTDSYSVEWDLLTKTDQSIHVKITREQKDASGKVIVSRTPMERLVVGEKPGERIIGGRWEVEPEARTITFLVEAQDAN